MSERKASVLICDDLLFALTGKVNLIGIYTQDIVIPSAELQMQQLIFFFIFQTPKDQLFQKITFRIELPDTPPADFDMPVLVRRGALLDERRKIITWRHPILLQQPVLKPGRISTSVIHEAGALDAGGIWIMTVEEAQRMASADSA